MYSVTIELEISEIREEAYKFYFCMTYLDARYNIEEENACISKDMMQLNIIK